MGLWEKAEENQSLIGCLIILTHSLLIEMRAMLIIQEAKYKLVYLQQFRVIRDGLVENAGMRICGYAGMRICGYAGMRICGYAGTSNWFNKQISKTH